VVLKGVADQKVQIISMAYWLVTSRESALLHHELLEITIYPMFLVSCIIELWKLGQTSAGRRHQVRSLLRAFRRSRHDRARLASCCDDPTRGAWMERGLASHRLKIGNGIIRHRLSYASRSKCRIRAAGSVSEPRR
jgi:hypothetical protein